MPRSKKSDMVQQLDLALCSLYEDGIAAFRFGKPAVVPFHAKKIVLQVHCNVCAWAVSWMNIHILHSSCSKQAFFYNSVSGSLNLHPLQGAQDSQKPGVHGGQANQGVSQKKRSPSLSSEWGMAGRQAGIGAVSGGACGTVGSSSAWVLGARHGWSGAAHQHDVTTASSNGANALQEQPELVCRLA